MPLFASVSQICFQPLPGNASVEASFSLDDLVSIFNCVSGHQPRPAIQTGRRADCQLHCHRHSLPDCAFSLVVGSPPDTALSNFAKRSSNAIALFAADSSTSSAEICRRNSSDAMSARAAVSPASANRVLLSTSCASSTAARASTACSCSTFFAWLRLASRSRWRTCLTEPSSVASAAASLFNRVNSSCLSENVSCACFSSVCSP